MSVRQEQGHNMAEYTERIECISSSNLDNVRVEFNISVTDGKITGSYDAYDYVNGEASFPSTANTKYPKKTIVKMDVYYYVTNRGYNNSGVPYAGSFINGVLTTNGSFGTTAYLHKFYPEDEDSFKSISSIPLNSYSLLAFISGASKLVSAYLGTEVWLSQGFTWYTGRKYNLSTYLSASGYGSANPPYAIRHFVDTVPEAIDKKPLSGAYFNHKDTNDFSWDMDWDRSLVVGILKLNSSIFKWRVAGTTTEHTINLGADIRNVSIPAGTFPNEDIEWGVIVTTDDEISSVMSWRLLRSVKSIPIQVLNITPQSGFINEKEISTFSWDLGFNSQTTFNLSLNQQSAIFQWRNTGSTSISNVYVTSDTFVNIPPNTLPNGNFEWRVAQATSTYGSVAPTTPWFLLTTVDQKPNKPTGLYPNTGSRDGSKVIQFSWIHNAPLSTPQSAFELQITYDNGTTWIDLSNKITTAVTQFNAAANTIMPTDPTGRIGWRVRTYNSDDIASDWSDTAFFIVHPAPQTPNWISVEAGRSRPLSRWTSWGQVGFQLKVLSGDIVLFDSGEIFGKQTEYRIPIFLNNGVFTFRLRIKNIRGLYSDWADRAVSINAQSRLNIILQGMPIEGGAQLTFEVEDRGSG